MARHVSVEMLRQHSRLGASGEGDAYLEQLLGMAEEAVARDLQLDSLDAVAGAGGELPLSLVQAVLMLAAAAYENREAEKPVQMHAEPLYWHLLQPWVKYRGETD